MDFLNEFRHLLGLDVILVSLLMPLLAMAVVWPMVQRQEKRRERTLAQGKLSSWYLLTGGERSDVFFDIDSILTDPEKIDDVANWYVRQIKRIQRARRIDKIAFIDKDRGPVGAISLAGLITQRTRIPTVIIRLQKQLDWAAYKGVPSKPLRSDDTIVLISDVTTTGRGVSAAIRKLLKLETNLRIPYVLVYVDRDAGAAQNLYNEFGDKFDIELIYSEAISEKEEKVM